MNTNFVAYILCTDESDIPFLLRKYNLPAITPVKHKKNGWRIMLNEEQFARIAAMRSRAISPKGNSLG